MRVSMSNGPWRTSKTCATNMDGTLMVHRNKVLWTARPARVTNGGNKVNKSCARLTIVNPKVIKIGTKGTKWYNKAHKSFT